LTASPLADRARYQWAEAEKLRFSDTDMVGHVNNVAYSALFESGRTGFGQQFLASRYTGDSQVVMARIEIDFLRELHWPGTVDVATCVLSLGRTSYVLGQGIFRDGTCFATCKTVLVLIDKATRAATPMPEGMRAALQALMA
jgi:acyl-CoA thioester hydrolase